MKNSLLHCLPEEDIRRRSNDEGFARYAFPQSDTQMRNIGIYVKFLAHLLQ